MTTSVGSHNDSQGLPEAGEPLEEVQIKPGTVSVVETCSSVHYPSAHPPAPPCHLHSLRSAFLHSLGVGSENHKDD